LTNTRGVLEAIRERLYVTPSPQSPPLKGGEVKMEDSPVKGGEQKMGDPSLTRAGKYYTPLPPGGRGRG